jgi:hypothetical protein
VHQRLAFPRGVDASWPSCSAIFGGVTGRARRVSRGSSSQKLTYQAVMGLLEEAMGVSYAIQVAPSCAKSRSEGGFADAGRVIGPS